MCSTSYPPASASAISYNDRGGKQIALILLISAMLLLAACAPKKDITPIATKPSPTEVETQTPHPFTRLVTAPKSAKEIRSLLELARIWDKVDTALSGLEEISETAPPPINEEAAFRRIELMLEFQYPQAVIEAEQLIESYPMHALTPYAYAWIARWWINQDDDIQALNAFGKLLKHPRLTRELAEETLNSATPIAMRVPEKEAVAWLLTAAEVDLNRREHWLHTAANRASLDTIIHLQKEEMERESLKSFYLYTARVRLMSGRMDELRVIAGILSTEMPYSEATRKVEAWASGVTQGVTIGLLLPLTGKYARFGEEALRGIRLALSGRAFADKVDLRIEDSESNAEGAVHAYQQLVTSDVAWVIGPLLSENAEALLPHLVPHIPVITLTNRIDIAEASPALFIHTLAKTIQAAYMAKFIWQQGARKVFVLNRDSSSSINEAETFTNTFEKLGGEVVGHLLLEDAIDNRSQLHALREQTDDEELLNELIEDIALLSAERELEIRIPPGFDGIYIALPGKRVSALAGQLAYVEINGIPLYGSSRWQDGHLLDDRGRYLKNSRFVQINFPTGERRAVQRLLNRYRETWGMGKPGKLFGMAYDSVLIAAVLSSRLGLRGSDAIEGLHDSGGFPGLTGHVRFDESGVGQKEFDLFTVKRGKLVPAG